MKKIIKKKVKKEEDVSETIDIKDVPMVGTSLLEIDFGRGDLNLMRDKLNEVIKKQNTCQ